MQFASLVQGVHRYASDAVASPLFASVISVMKAAALVSIIVMVGLMVLLIIRMKLFSEKAASVRGFLRPRTTAQKNKTVKEWKRIIERIQQDREAEDRLAVIEADKLLDQALKEMGYGEESFTERLKGVKPWHISNLDEVWQAHKIRNRVVHEPSSPLSHYDAETAVKIYEKALKGLGVID